MTVAATPSNQPVQKFTDLTNVTLTRSVLTWEDNSKNRTQLVPGSRILNEKNPGEVGIRKPFLRTIGDDFAVAMQAAKKLSQSAPMRSVWLTGSQPVAVVQAKDGMYAITSLQDAYNRNPIMVDALDFTIGPAIRQSFSREHEALQAIVGAHEWIDMRHIKVGHFARVRLTHTPYTQVA